MPKARSVARAILAVVVVLFSPLVVAQTEPPVQHSPHVAIAYPESSHPLPPVTAGTPPPVLREHPVRLNPFLQPPSFGPDPALQTIVPTVNMPATIVNFVGQGFTNGGVAGDPPDTNGAVGPNHYVQLVNTAIMIWNKSGGVLRASAPLNTLWTGYTGTNAGNACSTSLDGDPVVIYDQLADRWFITQFSLPNFNSNTAPSFQCVAVSKTGDPTGAYWLYDFQYNVVINDYGKFAIWPDAYYAAFNNFGAATYAGDNLCAYDRSAMLNGQPASQVCFLQSTSVFGILPVSLEGTIKPPAATPGFFLNLRSGGTTLGFYKFHVDFTTPANSTLTGPASLTVTAYTEACGGGTCIVQPAPGNQLDSLGDRLMFRATYRNFGTHESIIVNHSVAAAPATGVRWYEIRTPRTTPTIFQQGTYAPADAKYRWMGSIAQDQAQDMALGYSVSGSTFTPAVAWTGRTVGDAAGTMGQAEAIVHQGAGVETGNFSNGQPATRWGDYSNMTVDPSDDCTFWYTNEYYPANGIFNWDTQVASVKFPNCAQNNFGLSVTPASQSVAPGGQTTYTVLSTLTAGTAESIALNIQDLPSGVTGAFNPTSITAGTSSTLTLTASAVAPLTVSPVTFTVIGKAASAVHAATANVSVSAVAPPPAPTNVVATAASTTQVNVAWNLVVGATGYQVFRRAAGGAFALVGSPATNAFSDTTVTGGNAYLYKVQAVSAGGNSVDSNVDLATTVIFTDDPLVTGTTFIKGVHMTELRTAVSAVAALAATGPLTFTDNPVVGGTTFVKSVHVTELRSDLNTARSALSLPALTFANSAASNTVISATDFTELRNGVK